MRYNQPAKIGANDLKALFDVSPLQRTSHQDLEAYVNELQTHYKALQALNQPIADTVLLVLFVYIQAGSRHTVTTEGKNRS